MGVAVGAIALVAFAGAARAAMTDSRTLTRRGMAKFIQNDVQGSLDDFDAVLSIDKGQSPFLWQRGLSLYYLERYAEGAKQFRDDVAVNPNDTEESIWAFMCEAKMSNAEQAQKTMLKVGVDSRPYMRAAYDLFRGAGSLAELEASGKASPGAQFYSLLYIGLYNEALGEEAKAREAMIAATKTVYGAQSGDYMAALAAVHCKQRGWAA